MFQPFLDSRPEDANAEVAKRQAAQCIDPDEECRAEPAASPTNSYSNDNAPEECADEKACEEESELHARDARCHCATAQARPEGQADRISKAKYNAGSKISTCGRDSF